MADLTPDRLQELRRIAEAATPGPWWLDGWDIRSEDGDRFIASITDAFCGQRPDARLEELSANGYHISTFDPPTVLALLNEIERLRREREVMAEAVMGWQRYLERDVGTEIVHVRTLEAHGRALALLDGEEIVDNVTHFALYHPDLNVWECQADDCRFWWEFEVGNPYEHDMRFCPRCGRRIVEPVSD